MAVPETPAMAPRPAWLRVAGSVVGSLAGSVAVLTAVVLVWAGAMAGLMWADLSPEEIEAWRRLLQPRGGLLLLFALVLPLLLWAVVRPWVAAWPRSTRRLSEEVAVVTAAHAGHRVASEGPAELRELASAIDGLAQAHAKLRRDVDARVADARAELGEETRRLAALMSELTMGVLVCNREGRVLLYNARATALLVGEGEDGLDATTPVRGDEGAPLGLGRTVGSLLDAGAVDHAWQQVLRRHGQGEAPAVAHFVTALRSTGAAAGKLLRLQMVPTLDDAGAPGGYVLLIDDVTQSVQEHGRREVLLQRLTEGSRAALGNLRAAAQALHQYPAMDAGRRAGLTAVVHDEAERLARQLSDALGEPAGQPLTPWPLEDVQAADLAWALQRELRSGPGAIECAYDQREASRWLVVDSYAVVQMLAQLARRLHATLDARDVGIEVAGSVAAPRLDLVWSGAPLEPGTLESWERTTLTLAPSSASSRAVPCVRDVLDRHGAEWWPIAGMAPGGESRSASGGASGRASASASVRASGNPEARHRLCVQFAAAARGRRAPDAGSSPPARGRPIAYDFDLFHQAGQNARLDETPLAALAYTVFDTETTGLRPTEGDEIIALGAVRIVNGRLLEDERFDRRVRPRRAVRASAEAIHGISTASLAGEPPLEQVLPSFARFCEDTVLVAHNAAFDMRFLELARDRTEAVFDHPVLDTMLLSAAVLPGHGSDEHHLEEIAARLGVPVTGRHEALGDALTTARVFLKLLPLLAERGIRTLGQARAASRGVAQAHEAY